MDAMLRWVLRFDSNADEDYGYVEVVRLPLGPLCLS